MADSQPPPPKRKKPAFKRPTFKPPASSTNAADDRDFFSHTREIFRPSVFVASTSSATAALSPPKDPTPNTIPDDADSGDEAAPSTMRQRAVATRARFKEKERTLKSRRSASASQSPTKSRRRSRDTSITPPPQFPSPPRQIRRLHSPPPLPIDRPSPAPLPADDDDVYIVSDPAPAEDDYFAALERRARERSISSFQQPNSTPAPDPVVQIFVSSLIPKTGPLILKLRYRQKLKLLRNAWCRHYGLPVDDVFFLWKGAKVFDSMSCADIGVKLDMSTGEVEWPQEGVETDEGDEGTRDIKLHFEAVTEEIMKMKQMRKEQQEDEDEDMQPAQEEPSINLKLKAQGKETVGLKVRPTTTIAHLMTAYRSTLTIPASVTLSFRFDGDELGPDQTVEDAGLEDMDSIDVRTS